jgi:hypothetical protein
VRPVKKENTVSASLLDFCSSSLKFSAVKFDS